MTPLSRFEVSQLLGVSPNTITRWAREGKLPCQVTLGGHRRFDRAVIEDVRRRMESGPQAVVRGGNGKSPGGNGSI